MAKAKTSQESPKAEPEVTTSGNVTEYPNGCKVVTH